MRKYTIEQLKQINDREELKEALIENNDCYLGVLNDLNEIKLNPDYYDELEAELRYSEQYYDCGPTKEEIDRQDRLFNEYLDSIGR